jgi:hypothetical protein
MNKTIAFIVLLISVPGLSAQPVLNNNLNFAIGDSYRIDGYNWVTAIDPGGPGGNQVWDFETIEGEDFFEGEPAICVNPSTTPFADSAGAAGANITIKHLNSEFGPYQYHKTNASSRELLAMGWYETGNTSFTNYLNNYIELQFPMTYGDDLDFNTELLMYSVDMGFYVMRDSGHVTIEADAWGSIKTPIGTFPGVLRLKTTSVIHSWYRYDFGEPWTYLGEFTDISYNWYSPNIKVPVLTIMEFLFKNGGGEMFGLHYLADYEFATGIETVEKNAFSMFPNPAKDIVHIPVGEDHLAREIFIYDQGGKEVLRQHMDEGPLNVSELKPGCYFVELRSKNSSRTSKLVIK